MSTSLATRTIGRSRLSTLVLMFLTALIGNVQGQHQMDIGLFPSATPNVLELRVRSAQTFTFVVSEVTFTIRWETASGANLGAIGLLPCPSVTIPLVASPDGHIDQGGFRYQTYSGFGSQQLQQCGSQPGYNWPAGQEIVLATIPVSNISGCANFSIVNDSYTTANNKDFYASYGGSPVTGVVFSTPVSFCAGSYVDVSAKAFLDGAYVIANLLMRDNLRTGGLIPTAHPYGPAPFNYSGSETLGTGVLTPSGNNAIVDWVLLELRNSATPATIVARRAALIQRDGDIVDTDGVSAVRFNAVPNGNYYVAIRHRNHLGIMTATAIALSQSPTAIDLTLVSTATYGSNARKANSGVMALWGGNANPNGVVNYNGLNNDRQALVTLLGPATILTPESGYYTEDVTMNGLVNYNGLNNDRQYLVGVLGAATILTPRLQQLP